MIQTKGTIFVISGPSGAGKSTLVAELLKMNASIKKSVTYTTRPMRNLEKQGLDYNFISVQEFSGKKEQGCFLEHIKIFDHYYATDKQQVEKILEAQNCIVVLDTEGAKKLMQRSDVISIFIRTKSLDVLKDRMSFRKSETQESLDNRLLKVDEQIRQTSFFDYIITNDIFEDALMQLNSIIVAQECKNKGKQS